MPLPRHHTVDPTHPPRPATRARHGVSLRHRLAVIARIVAAVGGGYGCAALSAACLSYWPTLPRGDAVGIGMALSFAVMACVVIGVFAARSARRACVGVAMLGAVLYAVLVAVR